MSNMECPVYSEDSKIGIASNFNILIYQTDLKSFAKELSLNVKALSKFLKLEDLRVDSVKCEEEGIRIYLEYDGDGDIPIANRKELIKVLNKGKERFEMV